MTKNEVINNLGGKFFHVRFIKKDGTLRHMTGRLGVKKHTKGGKRTLNNDHLIVYEVNKKQYRAVNKDRIVYIKQGNNEWKR